MLGKETARAALQAALDSGLSVRRLYNSILENQHAAPGQITQSRPNVDPHQQTAGGLLSFNSTARLVIGTITDTCAIANAYRVQFEKYKQPMVATWGADSSVSAFGPRDLTTLQPGTTVVAMVHEQIPYAILLSVLPPADIDARRAIAQQLLSSTRNRADVAHKEPVLMHAAGNIQSWVAGRPFDSTTAGEKGWITETGLRIAIDSFLAQIGVDESCGLFAFYHDQLLRIAGFNMQFWTSGEDYERLLDGGEYHDRRGVAPFPWEQLGLFAPGDPRRELDAKTWQIDEPWYGKWEPKDDHQMAWHRHREFLGYLGQGGRRQVLGPPQSSQAVYASYQGGSGTSGAMHPLLYDHWVGLNGYAYWAAAKGFSLVKRIGIAAPVQMRRPDDPQGDTPENYRFSGVQGGGPAHRITSGPKATAEDPQIQRLAGIFDLHAYIFNYAGQHPFFFHNKDWKVHQESELDYTQGQSVNVGSLNLMGLAGQTILPPPTALLVKVDHRYGSQEYFQTEAGLVVTEDGGLELFDGWASAIRMGGGSIWESAAGDLWRQSGRSIIDWAGFDHITRAKNSVDITTTNKDVRIKAEHNLMVLAGNDRQGGMLFECRAAGPVYDFEKFGEEARYGGIIFRAPDSEVITWSMNVYLRTGGGDVKPGIIVLDANKGGMDVNVVSRTFNNFVSDGVFHFFGAGGQVGQANGFQPSFTAISTPTFIGGVELVAGHMINRGWTFSPSGHIATELSPQFSNFVVPLTGEGLRKAYEAVAEGEKIAHQTYPKLGQLIYAQELETFFYNEKRPGNDEVIEKGQFSYRILDQYKSEDFKLYESRWQQMLRLSGSGGSPWIEKPVTTHGQRLFPYPGKEKYEEPVFVTQDLSLFDVAAGHAKNRGSDGEPSELYADPLYAEPTKVKLDQYPVIR